MTSRALISSSQTDEAQTSRARFLHPQIKKMFASWSSVRQMVSFLGIGISRKCESEKTRFLDFPSGNRHFVWLAGSENKFQLKLYMPVLPDALREPFTSR